MTRPRPTPSSPATTPHRRDRGGRASSHRRGRCASRGRSSRSSIRIRSSRTSSRGWSGPRRPRDGRARAPRRARRSRRRGRARAGGRREADRHDRDRHRLLPGALALAEQHDGVYAALGIDPHQAGSAEAERVDELRELLAHPRAVAVGEAGLDYHYGADRRAAPALRAPTGARDEPSFPSSCTRAPRTRTPRRCCAATPGRS